jgi:hypothetical protein
MPYSYYPSSGSVHHAGKPAPDEGRGSFGPVFVVLAVITFLATAACIAGRLCGRRSSGGKPSSADAEKGLGPKHPVVAMRPLPSSRATVHDVLDDDVFEIKFAHVKPAGMGRERDGAGTGRVQALLPPPQLGLPRQFAPPGFRCAPANGGDVTGVARQAPHPQVRGAGGVPCAPPAKNQSR